MRWFPAMCHAEPSSLVFFWGMLNSLRWWFTDCSLDGLKIKCPKPVLIVRIHWSIFNINAVHVLKNTKKYILVSHMGVLKFISAPLKAKHFIGQLWQLMTASNVGARTQAWQLKWAVLKIPGFVCKHFLPFFHTPSPLFHLRHFSRSLWLSFLVLFS